uniref:Hyaluronidase n=1 Tax=Amphilophus citrinellus TaxID=61819 RepID=A0A3Q0SFR9_AMPCI
MVSVAQKSRGCVPLLLFFTRSIFPFSFFAALAALTAPIATTLPVADVNKSILILPATISTLSVQKSPTVSPSQTYFSSPASTSRSLSKLPLKADSNPESSASETSVPLCNPASHRDVPTSPSTSKKIHLPGKKVSASLFSGHCHHTSFYPFQPLKQISWLPSDPCKHLNLSYKTIKPLSHKNLQSPQTKSCLYPVSAQKVHLQPANPPKPQSPFSPAPLFLLSNSTLVPSLPQSALKNLLSPLSVSSLSAALTLKTTPPALSKKSQLPPYKTTSSPPEVTTSRLAPAHLPHATGPLFEHQPFTVTWNIPDLVCNRYNISLDTSPFKGVATPFLSLFYTDRLGLYPHIDLKSRKKFHGGIPQRANLKASLNKARADINYYIPSRGLAVIDWEEWRPLWDRNWGTKRIYQTLSVAHVMQANLSLTVEQATVKAKQQFQEAARNLMSEMLALGRAMRPNYLWGFYLFPNCYNYGWQDLHYTGQCSMEVRRQNDELLWLWESSTALYPSVYLSLADNPKAALMVRNRVQEALRVSALPGWRAAAPVFVYICLTIYIQRDLISTVGESVAVGASGTVLWGMSCEALSSYLTSTLNPYITNVTTAAQLCSDFLCRGNGRCVRKNYKSNHYLHLNPESFRVVRIQKRYFVLGSPSLADLKSLSRRFNCQCYKGLSCTPRTYSELAKALVFGVKQGLRGKRQATSVQTLTCTHNFLRFLPPQKAVFSAPVFSCLKNISFMEYLKVLHNTVHD